MGCGATDDDDDVMKVQSILSKAVIRIQISLG
jgi:hypothetical protein